MNAKPSLHSTAVIPAQAGIQTLVFQEYFKTAATSNFWIPACAGMTAEVSAKIVVPVFRRPFSSRCTS